MTPSEHPTWNPGLLRQARLDAGLTIEELGEAVRTLDVPGFRPPSGCPETVRRHETGRHKPRGPYRRAYCAVLRKTPEQLGFRPPTHHTTAHAPHDSGITSPHNTAAQPPATEGAATKRRDFVGLVAAGVGLTATGAPLTSAERLHALTGATAGTAAVAAAENVLAAVVADYLRQPPAATLARVASVQHLTDGVAAEYVLRPADTARLWRTAAIAAGIRGWIENNLGNPDAARLSLREAHRRGELLDDHQLIAWARYMQATVENYAGNPDAARRYALDGIAHTAPDSPQRAHLLMGNLACVLAIDGDTDGVHRAIDQAHTVISNLPAEQTTPPGTTRMIVDSMTTVGVFQFALDAGRAYARLGLTDHFTDVTSDARADLEQSGHTSLALYCADEALAVARSPIPDLDHARVLAGQALALADPFQTAHVGHRIDAVITAAGTTPAARDLAEELRSWRVARAAPAVATPA